jgi:hypothetical protein
VYANLMTRLVQALDVMYALCGDIASVLVVFVKIRSKKDFFY